ncbi:MAG: class I SAM-dependent methyltransferase [Candidatus Binatia bacterium]
MWFCAPQYLSNRVGRRTVIEAVTPYLRGVLLDLGSGSKPYRNAFSPYVSQHIGLEYAPYYRYFSLHQTLSADCCGDGRALPFRTGSCDVAFASEVLSYIEQVDAVMAEVYRVLKPGGTLIVTEPFLYPLRDTVVDAWRMTPLSLHGLAVRSGFSVEQVVPLGGFWVTVALLGNLYLFKDLFRFDRLLLRKRVWSVHLLICVVVFPFLMAWCAVVNLLCLGLEKFHPVPRFAYGSLIIARKP